MKGSSVMIQRFAQVARIKSKDKVGIRNKTIQKQFRMWNIAVNNERETGRQTWSLPPRSQMAPHGLKLVSWPWWDHSAVQMLSISRSLSMSMGFGTNIKAN